MSKKSSSWVLRYQARPDYASLAQFADKLEVSELSQGAEMFFHEEVLRDDEEEPIKDAEYYAKRQRKTRRFYRRKQTIVLEHDSKLAGERLHYEGKLLSQELNPEIDAVSSRSGAGNRRSTPSSSSTLTSNAESAVGNEGMCKYV
jgi:hypothetical protein